MAVRSFTIWSMKQANRGQIRPSPRSRRAQPAILQTDVNAAAFREVSPADPNSGKAHGDPDVAITRAEQTPSIVSMTVQSAATDLVIVPAPSATDTPSLTDSSGGHRCSSLPEASESRIACTTVALKPRAEQILKEHLPLAVGAGMIPVPGADLAAIAALQLKVLASLAAHYNVPYSQVQAKMIVTSLLGSVGTTLLTGVLLGSVAKFVPVLGAALSLASMPVAAAVITRAMGNLAIDHFAAGGTMETFDLDVARNAFLAKVAEARSVYA